MALTAMSLKEELQQILKEHNWLIITLGENGTINVDSLCNLSQNKAWRTAFDDQLANSSTLQLECHGF